MHDKLEEARGALQRAREDLRAARSASAQAAHEAAAEAGDKIEQVREVGREAAEQAGEKIGEAREVGREAVQQAGAQLQNAGESVRLAAESLAERLRSARRAAFQALHGRVNKPSEIPGPARAELRVHARRIAHLKRIRALAEKAGDKPALERTDKLIAREQSRHREQLSARLGHAPAQAKPAAARAPAADEDDEPGADEPEREEEDQGARTMKSTRILATVAVVALLACGGEERPKAEPAPLPAAAQPAAEPIAAPPEPSAEELPVPEDFEPEAETKITAANYREELDRLEREIAAQKLSKREGTRPPATHREVRCARS